MAKPKNKDPRISIGPGLAVYPALKRPDTKFDENGTYKADISVPLADAKETMDQLQEIHKAHTGKAAKKSDNSMWYIETDEAGEETGNVVFKCRIKNRISKKTGELWDRRPALFDAALKPVDVNPWGGSTYIVSADVYCWDAGGKMGVSLQPMGVQILDLKEGSGPSASSMGFAAQEGYTGSADVMDDDQDDQSDDTDDDDGDY